MCLKYLLSSNQTRQKNLWPHLRPGQQKPSGGQRPPQKAKWGAGTLTPMIPGWSWVVSGGHMGNLDLCPQTATMIHTLPHVSRGHVGSCSGHHAPHSGGSRGQWGSGSSISTWQQGVRSLPTCSSGTRANSLLFLTLEFWRKGLKNC